MIPLLFVGYIWNAVPCHVVNNIIDIFEANKISVVVGDEEGDVAEDGEFGVARLWSCHHQSFES